MAGQAQATLANSIKINIDSENKSNSRQQHNN